MFLLPARTPLQTVVVVLGSVAVTVLVWRTIAAVLRGGPDWWLLGAGVATLVCTVWFSALLVQDRDADIVSLRLQRDDARALAKAEASPASPSSSTRVVNETSQPSTTGAPSSARSTAETPAPLSSVAPTSPLEREPDPSAWSNGRVELRGIVVGATVPSFTTCRDTTTWRTVAPWSELPAGSCLCVRGVEGRRGAVLLETIPKDGEQLSAEISGVIWEPVVDE